MTTTSRCQLPPELGCYGWWCRRPQAVRVHCYPRPTACRQSFARTWRLVPQWRQLPSQCQFLPEKVWTAHPIMGKKITSATTMIINGDTMGRWIVRTEISWQALSVSLSSMLPACSISQRLLDYSTTLIGQSQPGLRRERRPATSGIRPQPRSLRKGFGVPALESSLPDRRLYLHLQRLGTRGSGDR